MSANKTTPHPHAESMLLYAQDAMETDRPWERWECSDDQEDWATFTTHPVWTHDLYYRQKPRTILINGIEVPEPVRRELVGGTTYWRVSLTNSNITAPEKWSSCTYDIRHLERGLIHLTEENARKHAEALLSFTKI